MLSNATMSTEPPETSTEHQTYPGPPQILTKSVTADDLKSEIAEEDSKTCEPTDIPPPKVLNETRHSIGSYAIPNRERLGGVCASLGVGRSNKPSQSENTLVKSQSEIQVCAVNSLSVSQTSRNSLMTYSSSGTFYDHSRKKMDVRIPPKPAQPSTGKDTTDFRQMEQGLLQLLEDFHCGKLEGFGRNCTFEKMENVREQQEKLARLHFDLNAQQEMCGTHTLEGITMATGNLSKLMDNLQQLSQSIEQLQSGSPEAEH